MISKVLIVGFVSGWRRQRWRDLQSLQRRQRRRRRRRCRWRRCRNRSWRSCFWLSSLSAYSPTSTSPALGVETLWARYFWLITTLSAFICRHNKKNRELTQSALFYKVFYKVSRQHDWLTSVLCMEVAYRKTLRGPRFIPSFGHFSPLKSHLNHFWNWSEKLSKKWINERSLAATLQQFLLFLLK